MKKMSFVLAIVVTAALAGCHHKKAPAAPTGGGDMGSGSAMGSAAGSGDMGSGGAGAGSAAGSGGM